MDLSSIDSRINQIADQFEAPRQLIDAAQVDKVVEMTQDLRLSGNFAGLKVKKTTNSRLSLRDFSICILRQRDGSEWELHI